MKLKDIKKEFENGAKIRLSFWPKGLYIKNTDVKGLHEKATNIYGVSNYSIKIIFKSILNILSNKWEVIK